MLAELLCAQSPHSQFLTINPRGHKSLIYDAELDNQGRIVTASFDKTCLVWDVNKGVIADQYLGQIGKGSEGMLYSVALSPDNQYLALAGWLGKDDESEDLGDIRIYNYESGKLVKVLKLHEDVIMDLAFTHDSKYLISGDASGWLVKWNVKTAMPLLAYENPSNGFTNVTVSPEGFYTAHPDGMVYKWNVNEAKPVKKQKFFTKLKNLLVTTEVHAQKSGEKVIVSGKEIGMMLVLDQNLKYEEHFFTGDNEIVDAKINDEGNEIIIAINESGTNYAAVYQKNGKEWNFFGKHDHDNLITKVFFIGPSRYVSIGGKDNQIDIWKAENFKIKTERVMKGVGTNYYSAGLNQEMLGFANDATKAYGNTPYNRFFDLYKRSLVAKDESTKWNYPVRENDEVTLYEYDFLRKTENDPSQVLVIEKKGQAIDSISFYPWDGNQFYSYSLVTNDRILVAGSYGILQAYDLNGKMTSRLVGHEGGIRSISKSDNGKFIVTSGVDMTIRFWPLAELTEGSVANPNTIKPVASFFMTDDNEWVLWNPEGYFTSSRKGAKYVGYHVNYGRPNEAKYYPFDQFDLKYNRPDILYQSLELADQGIIDLYYQAYLRRLKRSGLTEADLSSDIHVPVISAFNLNKTEGEVTIDVTAYDQKYPLKKLNVYLNDVPIYGSKGLSCKNKNEYSTSINIPLITGENKIEVSVANNKGVESIRETSYVFNGTEQKGNLFIASVGVSDYKDENFDLTYAAKDASDMNQLFTSQTAYDSVYTQTLVNEQVNKQSILGLKSFFNKAKPNDVVVLFIAGHGVLSSSLEYYFGTHDLDFNQPELNGVSYAQLESLFDGIRAVKKLLIMDTCHSGELYDDEVEVAEQIESTEEDIVFRSPKSVNLTTKQGLQKTNEALKEMFNDLNRGTGTTVISSAGGIEYAIESDEWKNGLFTYCFLKGITETTADYNQDGEIYLSEIQQYVQQQVLELSGGRQQPGSRFENISLDYRIW